MGRTSKTYIKDILAVETAEMTLQQIADTVGCSRATAYRILKANDLPYAGKRGENTLYDDALRSLDTGSMTYQEIASALNANPITVHRRLNVLGLPYKNPPKPKKTRIKVGDKLGCLKVTGIDPGRVTCLCECGKTITVVPGALQHCRSCGCLAEEYKKSIKGSYLDDLTGEITQLYEEGHTPGEIAYHLGVDRKHMAQWFETRIFNPTRKPSRAKADG